MNFVFYYECFGKHKMIIKSDNFRNARNDFFDKTSNLKYCNLIAIWEIDENGNHIKQFK